MAEEKKKRNAVQIRQRESQGRPPAVCSHQHWTALFLAKHHGRPQKHNRPPPDGRRSPPAAKQGTHQTPVSLGAPHGHFAATHLAQHSSLAPPSLSLSDSMHPDSRTLSALARALLAAPCRLTKHTRRSVGRGGRLAPPVNAPLKITISRCPPTAPRAMRASFLASLLLSAFSRPSLLGLPRLVSPRSCSYRYCCAGPLVVCV
ncbi:uncharacterized protein BKA78DRAFT_145467 [Phyllosticta capitalensis]|uniref:uncharacterized protein n=1 Tax=Phyllosticta capitalensis TaxID=121624 RepID=UPI00312EA012